MSFTGIVNLGQQLGGTYKLPKFWDEKERPFGDGQITKLAIHEHGGPGGVDINGAAIWFRELKNNDNALNVKTLDKPDFQEAFKQLLRVLAKDAELYFMCCLTAASADGTAFVMEVSKRLASKNVKVIAYTSTLATSGYMMHEANEPGFSGKTSYPGCRETNADAPNKPGAMELAEKEWDNFAKYPWASSTSKRATVGLAGAISKWGEDVPLPGNMNYAPEEKLKKKLTPEEEKAGTQKPPPGAKFKTFPPPKK